MRRAGQTLSRLQLLEGAWDMAFESRRTSSTSTSAICARRSTGRSTAHRSRRCAGSATACGRTGSENSSIRLRLTLPFAVGMALVLAAVGIVIYLRVGGALLSSVDQNLTAQAAEAVSHAHEGRTLLDRDVSDGPAIAEVELPDGTIDDSSPATLPPCSTRRRYGRCSPETESGGRPRSRACAATGGSSSCRCASTASRRARRRALGRCAGRDAPSAGARVSVRGAGGAAARRPRRLCGGSCGAAAGRSDAAAGERDQRVDAREGACRCRPRATRYPRLR